MRVKTPSVKVVEGIVYEGHGGDPMILPRCISVGPGQVEGFELVVTGLDTEG